MLNLSSRSFIQKFDGLCSICNLNVPENTFHFVGVRPILNSIRIKCFGVSYLDEENVICLLKGANFYALYKYLESAIKYRNLI